MAVDDGYELNPPGLKELAASFSSRQGRPSQLASRLQGASWVDTGDPSMDSQVREAVGRFTTLLTQFSEGLGQVAEGLRYIADNYKNAEDQAIASLDAIGDGLSQPGDGQPDSTTPVASLGIADKLNAG